MEILSHAVDRRLRQVRHRRRVQVWLRVHPKGLRRRAEGGAPPGHERPRHQGRECPSWRVGQRVPGKGSFRLGVTGLVVGIAGILASFWFYDKAYCVPDHSMTLGHCANMPCSVTGRSRRTNQTRGPERPMRTAWRRTPPGCGGPQCPTRECAPLGGREGTKGLR